MRIHSDMLTTADLYNAASGLVGVSVYVTKHGSRSHASAFEIALRGNSNRAPNTRQRSDERAATWDEWGIVFGRLYDLDPQMVCGSVKRPTYASADDFHLKTDYRFTYLEHADQHINHRWKPLPGSPRINTCECGAVRRWDI